jgi:hypothetical protein
MNHRGDGSPPDDYSFNHKVANNKKREKGYAADSSAWPKGTAVRLPGTTSGITPSKK